MTFTSQDPVKTSYDTVATDYARLLGTELQAKPLERAILAAFSAMVQAGEAPGPVADLGSGPGRISAHLHTLGLNVFGIDLSPAMVDVARRAYPHLQFRQGSMTAVDLDDNTLAGVVAWYSTVHTPPSQLPAIFAEFHRILAPGGHLLIAFKIGNEEVHLSHAYGHPVALDVYRVPVDTTTTLLRHAGLIETARLIREPDTDEKTPQAFLIAHKPRQSA